MNSPADRSGRTRPVPHGPPATWQSLPAPIAAGRRPPRADGCRPALTRDGVPMTRRSPAMRGRLHRRRPAPNGCRQTYGAERGNGRVRRESLALCSRRSAAAAADVAINQACLCISRADSVVRTRQPRLAAVNSLERQACVGRRASRLRRRGMWARGCRITIPTPGTGLPRGPAASSEVA